LVGRFTWREGREELSAGRVRRAGKPEREMVGVEGDAEDVDEAEPLAEVAELDGREDADDDADEDEDEA
jgi:hypothetical protein